MVVAIERRRVEAELAQTSAEVARLPEGVLRTLAPVLAQAQTETEQGLRTWLRDAKGEGRYTAQQHRTVLAHLERAMTTLGAANPTLLQAFGKAGAQAGQLAGAHLVQEIARYSSRFDRRELRVPLRLATLLAVGSKALVPRYRTSAARYSDQVQRDLRRELAVGVLRRESIDQLTARLASIGGPKGPVALRGVAGEPGARVEMIGEGLFKRYRFWGERLARTELQHAYNVQVDAGLSLAAPEVPGLLRRWDASSDLRLCPRCAELHGAVRRLDEPFAPDVGTAPLHPNCRCRVGAWRASWSHALPGAVGRPGTLPPPRPAPPPLARPGTLPPPGRPMPRRGTLPPPAMPPRPPAAPAAPALPPVPAFRTIAEAEAWARAEWPMITWDLTGIHKEVVRELLTEFRRLAVEWPEVVSRLEYVGTYRTIKAGGSRFRWSRRTNAHATQDGKRIAFNPAKFADPAKIRASRQNDEAVGWHPKGTGVAASVLTHEWGHQVDHFLQSRHHWHVVPAAPPGEVTSLAELLRELRHRYPATARLSRYALTNDAEAFAEGFAALRYTPAPERDEWTRRLGTFLELARERPHRGLRPWGELSDTERAAVTRHLADVRRRLGLAP